MNTLSVLIPFYNESAACLLLIKDLLSQELPQNWDLEIVVCNDGSESIDQNFINFTHEKFKLVNHEKNKGLSAARNTSIMYAQGDYLLFLDADIRLEKSKILTNYIEMINTGFSCINAPIFFKGNSLLNQYQNKVWRCNVLKSTCGLCLHRKHIKSLFNERFNHFGFEDKIFIIENNLYKLNPTLLKNSYITHYDESSIELVLQKFHESGQFGSPILRDYYPGTYKGMLYSKLDRHSSNFSPLSVLLTPAAPTLKVLVKIAWPCIFNRVFPLLTAYYYSLGCRQSKP